MSLFTKIFGTHSQHELKRITPIVDKIEALAPEYEALSDEELQAKTPEFKERLANGETLDDILVEAFATVREAATRVLNMRHYRVQLIGGVILHQGRITEMRTGEGKTLVSTLPAYLNALEGKGVHIVTVNDYLAKRDAEWMGKVHEFLGLTVGVILNSMDNDERRDAYNCDITYATNNELGFDYLRDNMVVYKKDLVQRELHYAIIDEVDSVLIDEARTPLIISGQSGKSTKLYEACDIFVKQLTRGTRKELSKMDILMAEDEQETGDYVVDEKEKNANLTEEGVRKAERFFGVDNLADPDNLELQHNINLALRAHSLMARDKDYVVKDDEVLIVDEFTGRIMPGRRYSDGLHQAIEAKEHVKVKRESKTLATITFQNFFNKYEKKSGMTGTALTEEKEFRDIYGMDVIEVPTNLPIARIDYDDAVYKTKKDKFNAVVADIVQAHEKGQPVLVGTITIDTSEMLSQMLQKKGIPHKVLNAKFHELEAEIIADAGQMGAVTIATNMAGRGTDIMLGGNAEFLAKAQMKKMEFTNELINEATGFAETDDEEILNARKTFVELEKKYKDEIKEEADKVREAGGLFILGTERHDARRIDNQLRGRSGRQGDPGVSQFYLSLEDDLMRLFGGDRMQKMMVKLTDDEDMEIKSKLITKTIENAQKKVEGKNFGIRKNTLQYDDVMNRQRELIYGQRNQVLDGLDLTDSIFKMLDQNIDESVKNYLSGDKKEDWNVDGLREKYKSWLIADDNDFTDVEDLTAQDVIEELQARGHKRLEDKRDTLGDDMFQEFERMILLRNVDTYWMDHIDAMEELKRGIHLRAYAQRDPVVAYRMESYDMFDEMTAAIREDTAKMLLTLMPRHKADVQRKAVAKVTSTSSSSDESNAKQVTIRKEKKVGPNDPCPCGSGLKYKKCCGSPAKLAEKARQEQEEAKKAAEKAHRRRR